MGYPFINSILEGPDITTPSLEVVRIFFLGLVAVSADIQQTFPEVMLTRRKGDAFLLLWWAELNYPEEHEGCQLTVSSSDLRQIRPQMFPSFEPN